MGVAVVVKGWPLSAYLHSWGRSVQGLRGLIVWESNVCVDGVPERATFAAWVPAYCLTRVRHVPNARMRVVELPGNRSEWPIRIDCDYFLADWDESGTRLPMGVTLDSGPRRARRSA